MVQEVPPSRAPASREKTLSKGRASLPRAPFSSTSGRPVPPWQRVGTPVSAGPDSAAAVGLTFLPARRV